MPRRDAVDMARTDTIDLVRTLVRYKHRVAMRAELNDIESEILDEFDEAVVTGQEFELAVEKLLKSLEG
jgi:hypothetical protein